MRVLSISLLVLLCVSLATPARCEVNQNARHILERVEARLLAAKNIEFFVYVDIKEPYARSLNGPLKLEGDRMEGDFRGSIGPDQARLLVTADGKELKLSLNADQRSGTQPAALRESMLVSLIRIGFANTLINLSQLKPPEHSEGGVKDWITVENVQVREAPVSQGYHSGEIALQFAISINGKPGGHTRLWISTQTGLPLRREQFFDYETADGKKAVMRADERYTTFIADP